MEIIQNIFNWIINNLLQQTAVIIGGMVILGKIADRKSFTEILQGFIKAVIGYTIFSLGINSFIGVMGDLGTMISNVLNVPDMKLSATYLTDYGMYYGPIIGFGFLLHLLIERFLIPRKYRFVYMGGGHFLLREAVATSAIAICIYGVTNIWAIIIFGSVMSAIWYSLQPIYVHKFVSALRGDNLCGYGHQSSIAVFITCHLCNLLKLKKNEEDSTENIIFPKGIAFMRDMGCAITIIVALLLLGFGIACGGSTVQEIAGITTDPWVWIILQACTFAGGFLTFTFGLRTMMAELIPSFNGISEKIIPGARPALDVPTVFPFGTNAVFIGSTVSIAVFLVLMVISSVAGWGFLFPAVQCLFMSGAGVAVFGNKFGGKKGAVLGGAVVAVLMAGGLLLLQFLLGQDVYNLANYATIMGEVDDYWICIPIYLLAGRIFGERIVPFGA